jgi:hypothetical protein
MIFIVQSSLETVHDTVQYRYCIFSLLSRLLRIRLKRQNPLLSYIRYRKYTVNVQCSLQYTIITLFNVDNVLLCVIYQLNFTVFMYVT